MGHRQARGVLRGAGPWRGRADHHRRVRPHQARLAQAVRVGDDQPAPRQAARTGHGAGARRRRRDRVAGAARRPLRLPPAVAERVGQEVADHAVPAERDVDQGGRPHRDRLRQDCRPRPQGGLRRGRDHGLRGLPHQPVPRRTHQRPRRPVGRIGRAPDALPRRGRTPLARAGRRRLPDRLPDLAARPRRGRPDLGRDRRARPAPPGRRRHCLQHRHRLARGSGAHDHHAGPAWRLAVVHRPSQAGRRRAGLRLQPHQHPRARRGHPRRR